MSTSKHTFDQVKSILGKLDRSIDDARAKRLDGDTPLPPAAELSAAVTPAQAAPAGAAVALPAQESRPSEYGVARPLRATPNYSNGSSGPAATPFKGRGERGGF